MKNKIADIYDSSVHGIDKKHIPDFRFPEFANTGEWEKKKVEEVCKSFKTGKLDANAMVKDGKYRFYTCSKDYSFIDTYAFDGDCILIAGNGAHLGYVHHYNGKFNAYQRTYVLANFSCNSNYLEYCIKHFLPNRITKEKKEGNTPYIVLSTLTDMPIFLPPTIAEQQKIAECLSAIDEQILATQQKWDSLKEYKRGLMQKLFPANGKTTPDFRFPEFANAGEWETPTISEIFEIRNGYTPSKSENAYWDGGTIPWFRMEDIRENGGILSDSIQHITSLGVKGKGLFKKNSIILATTATIGIHAMIIADSLANQRFTNFSIRESLNHLYSPKYIYYAFYEIDEWCKRNTNAGGLLSVNMSALLKKTFYTPTLAEQQKIAECLSSLDELITAQAQKAEALKEHKRGLMQRLFPNNNIDFKN